MARASETFLRKCACSFTPGTLKAGINIRIHVLVYTEEFPLTLIVSTDGDDESVVGYIEGPVDRHDILVGR